MDARQTVSARQNQVNFLAVDTGSDRQNMTSRSVQQHSNSASFGGAQAPMNFNFVGGQHQISNQQPGVFQSLSSQNGINNAQLLQQQLIIQQMQELQRRQQFQQFEAMQNSMNHMSTFPHQPAGEHSQTVNGNPMQNASNYPRQSQVNAGGTNWHLGRHPSVDHTYSNGLMVNREQSQAMQFMGMTPRQPSHSLYGVPVSNLGGANPSSLNSMDKQSVFRISAPSSSFSGSSYAHHAEQVNNPDPSTVSRSEFEGTTSFEHASSQGLQHAANLRGYNQVQQRKVSLVDGSDVSPGNSLIQAAASQSIASEATTGLDPTEEKFLFGNDVNIWDAFGESPIAENDRVDIFNEVPSLQSGTWSALMQSAVAETSSSDVKTHEEWGGLESPKSRSQTGNQQLPIRHDKEKPPTVWADSSQRGSEGWRTTTSDVNANNATSNTNYSHNSRFLQPYSNQTSLPIESQVMEDGRRWLDSNSPKSHHEEKPIFKNPNFAGDLSKTDTAFGSHHQRNEHAPHTGDLGLSHINSSRESSQRRPSDNHSLDQWKQANFATESGILVSGNDHNNINTGKSAANFSVNTSCGGVSEMRRTENGDGRRSLNDTYQNSFPNHTLPDSSRENVWSEAGDAGRKVPVSHKFQYHPMGDVNIDEPSSGKPVDCSQPISPSFGLKVLETQPTKLGPSTSRSSDAEKDQQSGFPGGVEMLHGSFSSSAHQGQLLNTSSPFSRSGENSSPSQHLSPSQNMLELLHKVDQSNNQNAVSNLCPLSVHYNSSNIPADGLAGPDQSQSSTPRGFNLQLAPPSQRTVISNLNDPAQSSLRSVGSLGSQIESSENGDKSIAWLASEPSTQSSPPSHGPPQMDSGNDKFGGLVGAASLASNSTYLRNSFQNQHVTAAGGQMMSNYRSSFVSSEEHAYRAQQSTISKNQAIASQSASNLSSNFASEKDRNLYGISTAMHPMASSVEAKMEGMGKDNMSSARSSSDFMKSHFQTNAASDRSCFSQQMKDELDGLRNTDAVSSSRALSGKEPLIADPLSSGKNALVSQEESVGRQSMQAMKSMSMDPNLRESKRLRDQENCHDPQQMAENAAEQLSVIRNSMVRDPLASQTALSSGDAMTLRFSHQSGNSALQDRLSFDLSDSQTFVTGNLTDRVQFTGISPQMAPSWFEQYGTFRNGQLLPVHNMPRIPTVKNVEQQFVKPPSNLVVRNSMLLENAVTDNCQIKNTNQIKNMYTSSEHISSLHTPAPNASPRNPVSMRHKKRKTATSDLIPWSTEITLGFRRIQNISFAEADWAQSSNRLVERDADGTDSCEDISPMNRPRRRLILTTKLMQQVFCPPSASIFSLDGRSYYEISLYSIARLGLGDACNLICDVKSDLSVDNGNSPSVKTKMSEEGIRDQYFSKVVEDFTKRAKELENDLLGLDKRYSILDFRLDYQELEKMSLINRFARFYSSNQVERIETSSSSDGNAISQKPFQRHFTIHHMPKAVPEMVQCRTIN